MKLSVTQMVIPALVLNAITLGAARSDAQIAPEKARPFPLRKRAAPRYDLNFLRIDAVQLLRYVASRQGAKIVIDADVRFTFQNLKLRGVTLEGVLRVVSAAADLTWAKVDQTTYVLVRRRPFAFVIPPSERIVPPLPGPDIQIPKIVPDEKPSDGWFSFNGKKIYVVPLH